jgi:predicted O-methyltransferase YrrM
MHRTFTRWHYGKGEMTLHNSNQCEPAAGDGSVAGRIMQLRQMHAELRARPTSRSLRLLKTIFFKAVGSAFRRQFTINSATVDLIEALYRDLEHTLQHTKVNSGTARAPAVSLPAIAGPETLSIATGTVVTSGGLAQDQAKLNNIRPLNGFSAVYTSPAELRMPERVALYSLVFGLQPKNCLEIGSFRGGSSAIICGALDDTGFGQLSCVEPHPHIDDELWGRISNRSRLFQGHSPGILPDVFRQAGAPFDFVFIDADHQYDTVRRDIAGVLPFLADRAYVLFHDANHSNVKRAVDDAVFAADMLTDCGMISVEPTVLYENGKSVAWAGLRLLRFERPLGKVMAA